MLLCSPVVGVLFFRLLHNEFFFIWSNFFKNMLNTLSYHLKTYKTIWYSWNHWKALDEYLLKIGWPFFGKISPFGHQKKGGTINPTEDFFNKNGTKSPYFKEKKVKWRAPKSLVRPKLGPSYFTVEMWGTRGTLPTFSTKRGRGGVLKLRD
jgi:hypothetical protein